MTRRERIEERHNGRVRSIAMCIVILALVATIIPTLVFGLMKSNSKHVVPPVLKEEGVETILVENVIVEGVMVEPLKIH